jgi:2-methylisocitrate lyase-like PEP mutase family enzyme
MSDNNRATDPTIPPAALLRRLHVPGEPLVAPNAWDAASARSIERAGFDAVSTSSAAIASSLGWEDGEAVPVEEMLSAGGRIARGVEIPVTVDFERGYGLGPEELVERFSTTGAVGLNLEDSDPHSGALAEPAEQARFLSAVREAARAAGIDLVINARTDSFLRHSGTASEQLEASIIRGNLYLAAGADCIYPLGAGDPKVIEALTTRIEGPVNVASSPRTPIPIKELAALGVARVTFGPGLQRRLYAAFDSTLADLRAWRS